MKKINKVIYIRDITGIFKVSEFIPGEYKIFDEIIEGFTIYDEQMKIISVKKLKDVLVNKETGEITVKHTSKKLRCIRRKSL